MNETSTSFEMKYLNKMVRPTSSCKYDIKKVNYHVTAALYKYEENDISIFAIMDEHYSMANNNWITFKLNEEEVKDLDNQFEIISSSDEMFKDNGVGSLIEKIRNLKK
jgi:hypothetical protein